MDNETVSVDERGTTHAKLGQLILSVVEISTISGTVEFVVGHVGLPNLNRETKTGAAVLFETPEDGLF
jgi:hypothetical protein